MPRLPNLVAIEPTVVSVGGQDRHLCSCLCANDVFSDLTLMDEAFMGIIMGHVMCILQKSHGYE